MPNWVVDALAMIYERDKAAKQKEIDDEKARKDLCMSHAKLVLEPLLPEGVKIIEALPAGDSQSSICISVHLDFGNDIKSWINLVICRTDPQAKLVLDHKPVDLIKSDVAIKLVPIYQNAKKLKEAKELEVRQMAEQDAITAKKRELNKLIEDALAETNPTLNELAKQYQIPRSDITSYARFDWPPRPNDKEGILAFREALAKMVVSVSKQLEQGRKDAMERERAETLANQLMDKLQTLKGEVTIYRLEYPAAFHECDFRADYHTSYSLAPQADPSGYWPIIKNGEIRPTRFDVMHGTLTVTKVTYAPGTKLINMPSDLSTSFKITTEIVGQEPVIVEQNVIAKSILDIQVYK